MVFRHEGARRRRCRERARAHGGRDDGQGARRQGDGSPDPRGRRGGLRRQGLRQRGEEARGGRRGRALGGEGESETGARSHASVSVRATAASARCARRSSTSSASSNASSAIARCAIAASPRTARRCSRSWRSPISTSPAADLRPQREGGGFGAPRLSRQQANPSEKAVPVATDDPRRPCYSEVP